MEEKDMLSQEEINALLSDDENESGDVTKDERDALGEIGNISIGSSATTLYTLLDRKVKITTPRVELTNMDTLTKQNPIPFVAVEVDYTKGLEGANVLIIKEEDAKIIADLMMGGDGTNTNVELDDIRLSAISEAMNQMMGAASTSMSTVFKKDINISPPTLKRVDFNDNDFEVKVLNENNDLIKVAFNMEVGDLINSEIMQLIPLKFAKKMVNNLKYPQAEDISKIETEANQNTITAENDQLESIAQVKNEEEQKSTRKEQNIDVKPVKYNSFSEKESSQSNNKIDLIMDVSLEVTVELGKTKKQIREILKFGPGSIIELDKLAGEPVDILVNGKSIAKGEVVVIDENFGVRITDIISPIQRVNNLQ